MIKHIKRLLGIGQESAPTPAPYKVETPNTVAEQATQAVVESIVPAKKTAKPKAEKKPAAKKTTRKPRTPKA
jgi:hypothetical protein